MTNNNQSNSTISGFWFSYIDSLTILASIFLILFIVVSVRQSIADRKFNTFIKAWDTAEARLDSLKANPVLSPESGGWLLNIAENILFDSDSASISERGFEYLREVGQILNDFTKAAPVENSMRIVVGGHADTTYIESYNLWLSDQRANNVANELKKTMPDIFMEAIGYGEKFPKKTYKESRRITIVIQPISVHLLSKFENIKH